MMAIGRSVRTFGENEAATTMGKQGAQAGDDDDDDGGGGGGGGGGDDGIVPEKSVDLVF